MIAPDTLRAHPQLAALQLLVDAAETVIVALHAAHPVLGNEADKNVPAAIDILAARIARTAYLTTKVVHRYGALLNELDALDAVAADESPSF